MPAKLTKDEQDLMTHIKAHMKKYHTTSWFQIHGFKHSQTLESLKKKGMLVWDLTRHEYVLGREAK